MAEQTVEVNAHYDNAVGSSDAASQGVIRAELLKSRPALRPGEVLEFVPGMIVTQHSGDGKANQYFLRGFNLDHGTDFATSLNGMPVNMPTHAHGQGYTDLNFLLPELVQRIDYRKGPYFARSGDFASAGAADIVYRTHLDAPFGQLTLGQNGYRRGVLGGSGDVAPGTTLLGAIELMGNDGPWAVPEGLRRVNGVLTLHGGSAAQGWQASLMGYEARWTSTDQIPQRLIDAGTYQGQPFGRFDSLDASDGGNTSRFSLSGEWHRLSETGNTKVSAYAMRYRLKLFSNFSYAAERPEDGDQFSQQDARGVYGLSASHTVDHVLAGLPARSEFGLQLRHDRIRVGLFDTAARQVIGTTRDDQVRETLAGVYGQSGVEFTPWLRGVVGLRADSLRTRVDSLSLPANSGAASDAHLSPKLSLIAGPFQKTELFFNAGRGFHSNDARGTTIRVDPKSGEPVDRVPGLVASRGIELGARSELIPGLQSSLALWRLNFDSELVYVGDAGATEASAASRRHGVELNNRWTPARWFLVDADFAWTHARFNHGDRIPNAVDKVASVAVTARELGPWSASLQWRYLGSGALIEDNSVRSTSSLTTNLRVTRKLPMLGADSELTLDVFNLGNRRVNDIQYFYESQMPGEAAPVADRHVHPAEPRTLRLTLRVGF
ncbi:MAG: TonB-dependent receptor plug domain-containing protein [Ideonella sp.]|nr:TonB-dependent receptor plug domain-containing protein [Ideonella sp.]